MKTAIVILNYNGAAHLRRFLPDVVRHCPSNTSIIVADNASTDGSAELVLNEFPEVRWIPLDKNYGFAGGYNRALENIHAEYYAILNSDVEVTEGWLEELIGQMDRNPDVAACQPKILDFHNRDQFEYAGAAGGFIDKNGFLFCRGRLFDHCEVDTGQHDEPREVFWASGACLIIRSKAFHEVEGFDADFFAHMEEVDLCWRIKNRGGRIFCFPQSVVYHLGGGTLSSLRPMKTYLNFRNNLTILVKNQVPDGVFLKMTKRMVFDGAAAFHLLFTRGFGHFIAVMKAHLYFYVFLPDILEKRRREKDAISQPIGGYPNLAGLYRGSVVMDFFKDKKKDFKSLDPELFVRYKSAAPKSAK